MQWSLMWDGTQPLQLSISGLAPHMSLRDHSAAIGLTAPSGVQRNRTNGCHDLVLIAPPSFLEVVALILRQCFVVFHGGRPNAL